jgi:hypothetical protein
VCDVNYIVVTSAFISSVAIKDGEGNAGSAEGKAHDCMINVDVYVAVATPKKPSVILVMRPNEFLLCNLSRNDFLLSQRCLSLDKASKRRRRRADSDE